MIKAVFFDLDNTLTDFMRMKDMSVIEAIEAMIDAGLKMSPETARQRIDAIYEREGIEFQQVFDHFLQEELGEIDHKILAAGIVGYRRAHDSSLALYPHVNHTLNELAKRGIKLAVVSDAPQRQAWLRLCYLKLHHIFDEVITYEDTKQRKPSPAPFKKALVALDLEPHEVLMVGDWPERDMVGAAKVGIPTVYARYGDRPGTTVFEADYVIDDIIDVLDIAEKHGEAGVEKQKTGKVAQQTAGKVAKQKSGKGTKRKSGKAATPRTGKARSREKS